MRPHIIFSWAFASLFTSASFSQSPTHFFAPLLIGQNRATVTTVEKTKKTVSGVEFKRVSEDRLKALGVTDPEKFGEAWQDPTGAIWGDIAKHDGDGVKYMFPDKARDYCKSLGAELPSGYPEDHNGKFGFPNKDSDFVRLSKYMGKNSKPEIGLTLGYVPQVLPNLTFEERLEEKREIIGYTFWSASVRPEDTRFTYNFISDWGLVSSDYRESVDYGGHAVRCLVRDARMRN